MPRAGEPPLRRPTGLGIGEVPAGPRLLPPHYASRRPRRRPPRSRVAAVAAAGAAGPATAAPWPTRQCTPPAHSEPPPSAASTSGLLQLEDPVGQRLRLSRTCRTLQETSQSAATRAPGKRRAGGAGDSPEWESGSRGQAERRLLAEGLGFRAGSGGDADSPRSRMRTKATGGQSGPGVGAALACGRGGWQTRLPPSPRRAPWTGETGGVSVPTASWPPGRRGSRPRILTAGPDLR